MLPFILTSGHTQINININKDTLHHDRLFGFAEKGFKVTLGVSNINDLPAASGALNLTFLDRDGRDPEGGVTRFELIKFWAADHGTETETPDHDQIVK